MLVSDEKRLTTTILESRGVERAEPDGVNTQFLEVGNFFGDTLQISNTISVGISE
jgi:hypothetical protein